jgi:DNA invertase Pin-like site-specific DNA recombinase
MPRKRRRRRRQHREYTDCVLYARYSPRPNAADSLSNETQLKALRQLAAQRGWKILAEKSDRALTGTTTARRQGFAEAVELACQNRAVLVVYALSRFARSVRDTEDVSERLNRAGAGLASATEHFDTTSAMGNAMFLMMAVFAQLEAEVISERTADAMRSQQEEGLRMTRVDCLPYGWKLDVNGPTIHRERKQEDGTVKVTDLPARMIPDPDEQRILNFIRVAHVECGWGAKRILANLIAGQVPCRGKRWHLKTLRRLLKKELLREKAKRVFG